VTVKEIAGLAGVSIGTVDRVLHGRGRVSKATRERIEAIVLKRGYRPNPMARHLKLGKEYRFAALMPGAENDEGYWDLAMEGVRETAAGIASFGVRVEIITFDRDKNGAAIEALESISIQDLDGLLAAPVETGDLGPALGRLCPMLPVVFFDAETTKAEPLVAIIQDPLRSGRLAGRLLDSFCPRQGSSTRRFALVNPHPRDEHLSRRMEGVASYFSSLPGDAGAELTRISMDGGSRAAAAELARRSSPSPFDGVVVVNAQVAEVAGTLEPRPRIIGYDLVPANVSLLREGRIDALISQDPAYQAGEGIRALYRSVVLGEPPASSELRAPLDVYFAENLPEQEATGK